MSDELKNRTRAFALRVIKMVDRLPKKQVMQVIGNQILRSGTSVGANYRAACRARSKKEFISKLGIVEEECDETIYWKELLRDGGWVSEEKIELLRDGGWVSEEKIEPIKEEAEEILKIMVTSCKTAKNNKERKIS